jgi:hypothetical protein
MAEVSPEQKELLEIEDQTQRQDSFLFMTRYPTYVNSEFNNTLIAEWLIARKLPWRLENLEKAYTALRDDEAFDDSTLPLGPPKPAAAAPADPWSTPLTLGDIATMDRADYKKNLQNPKFRDALNALGIKA